MLEELFVDCQTVEVTSSLDRPVQKEKLLSRRELETLQIEGKLRD